MRSHDGDSADTLTARTTRRRGNAKATVQVCRPQHLRKSRPTPSLQDLDPVVLERRRHFPIRHRLALLQLLIDHIRTPKTSFPSATIAVETDKPAARCCGQARRRESSSRMKRLKFPTSERPWIGSGHLGQYAPVPCDWNAINDPGSTPSDATPNIFTEVEAHAIRRGRPVADATPREHEAMAANLS